VLSYPGAVTPRWDFLSHSGKRSLARVKKLDRPGKEIAGFISVAALFQIGIILMF